MSEDEEIKISPTGEKIYHHKKLPRKFCPYCGKRNEPSAENCENCGKDISWIKIPEDVPGVEEPKLEPQSLPKQKQAFKRWQVVVIWIVVVLLMAAIVTVIALATRGNTESGESLQFRPVEFAGKPVSASRWYRKDQARLRREPGFGA